jgi:uncharacterized protein YrrD
MLLLGERLIGTPIMSLQVGVKIAETVAPVIDPKNLAIIAYEVDGPLLESRPSFIRIADIRELSDIGMIIDSSDELVGESDVIKILVGMRVIDTNGKKLGKIVDYTLDTDSFIIQQLSVHGGIISSISNTEHVIHRSQITEINDTTIIVRGTDKKLTSLETTGKIHQTYTNPFRKSPEAQPETTTVQN